MLQVIQQKHLNADRMSKGRIDGKTNKPKTVNRHKLHLWEYNILFGHIVNPCHFGDL